MGRPIRVDWEEARRKEGLLEADGHSHFNTDSPQYVVFDSAQIITCYILHVDYGAEDAREEFERNRKDPWNFSRNKAREARSQTSYQDQDTSPGAVQARKEALKAAAAKWFPYGCGPATGTSSVIEDIGEVSDDEEEYGDYRALRKEQGREMQDQTEQQDAGGSWFDEYQTVRRSYKSLILG
jgi:hypothetical protein